MRRTRNALLAGETGLQRRVRRLAPRSVRSADLALFRLVARSRVPVVGPLLRPLSTAANHSRLWMGIALVLAVVRGREGRRAGLRGLLALGATSALTNLPAKLLTGRARPDRSIVPEARRLARVPTSTSFPSGNSASALAFATGAAMELPAARVPLLGLAAAVAGSRVYTGVHYPGDVLVGAAIGAAVARSSARAWPLADDTPAAGEAVAGLDLPAPDGEGLVIVANSGAGTALGPEPADRLRRELPGARIITADEGEDLVAVLRRAAAQGRAIGAAGGDGSASAAAGVAAQAGLPLVVVPAGTLNHLATDLGIDDLSATVRAIGEGRAIAMDVAEIAGRTFVNAASVGAYPHLVQARERLEERVGKWPAVLWCGLRILANHPPHELEIDGRRRRVWLVFIGNCAFRAPGIAPHRRDRVDDGLLDLRIVTAERSRARLRLLGSLLTGRLGTCSVYERHLAREVRIRGDRPLQLAADGETWEGPEEIVVRKSPTPLLVLQPDPAGT
jgi:diacylglycerol kinase family enzyme/membrane-associated phospholipid phosphatase